MIITLISILQNYERELLGFRSRRLQTRTLETPPVSVEPYARKTFTA